MEMENADRLARLLKKLDQSSLDRLSSGTKQCLLNLIPGKKYFDALITEFTDKRELDNDLSLIVSSLQDISDNSASQQDLQVLESSVVRYTRSFERAFLLHLDMTRGLHQETLSLLRAVLPTPAPKQSVLFLLSGPSASGKDTLLGRVLLALRARGYSCEHMVKYTTRPRRSGESTGNANYYRYISDAKFARLCAEKEIIFEYAKYRNRYGLSRTQLVENGKQNTPTLGIVSDFHIVETIDRELKVEGIRVIPILIFAPVEDCRVRTPGRNLSPEDADERLLTLEADCTYIVSNPSVIQSIYQFNVFNGDQIAVKESSKTLYMFIEGCLASVSSEQSL